MSSGFVSIFRIFRSSSMSISSLWATFVRVHNSGTLSSPNLLLFTSFEYVSLWGIHINHLSTFIDRPHVSNSRYLYWLLFSFAVRLFRRSSGVTYRSSYLVLHSTRLYTHFSAESICVSTHSFLEAMLSSPGKNLSQWSHTGSPDTSPVSPVAEHDATIRAQRCAPRLRLELGTA